MSDKWGTHYLRIAALVAFTALIVPTAFGDIAKDGWVKYIYNYQTLLTGILAVAAAFVTVRQMRASDALSEQRHRQLIRFQVRNDRMAIERIKLWLPNMLNIASRAADKFLQRPRDDPWSDERKYALLEAVVALDRLTTDLVGPRTQPSAYLFSPIVHTEINAIAGFLEIALKKAPRTTTGAINAAESFAETNWFDGASLEAVTPFCKLAPIAVRDIHAWADASLADFPE